MAEIFDDASYNVKVDLNRIRYRIGELHCLKFYGRTISRLKGRKKPLATTSKGSRVCPRVTYDLPSLHVGPITLGMEHFNLPLSYNH